ncbi:hypothetical protein BJX61DRAFT_461259 [Aspergillus egyptiacus]|nr:hypothetical protein BJX61DRAFT_461259 [Aspergillus egyptiacus]
MAQETRNANLMDRVHEDYVVSFPPPVWLGPATRIPPKPTGNPSRSYQGYNSHPVLEGVWDITRPGSARVPRLVRLSDAHLLLAYFSENARHVRGLKWPADFQKLGSVRTDRPPTSPTFHFRYRGTLYYAEIGRYVCCGGSAQIFKGWICNFRDKDSRAVSIGNFPVPPECASDGIVIDLDDGFRQTAFFDRMLFSTMTFDASNRQIWRNPDEIWRWNKTFSISHPSQLKASLLTMGFENRRRSFIVTPTEDGQNRVVDLRFSDDSDTSQLARPDPPVTAHEQTPVASNDTLFTSTAATTATAATTPTDWKDGLLKRIRDAIPGELKYRTFVAATRNSFQQTLQYIADTKQRETEVENPLDDSKFKDLDTLGRDFEDILRRLNMKSPFLAITQEVDRLLEDNIEDENGIEEVNAVMERALNEIERASSASFPALEA